MVSGHFTAPDRGLFFCLVLLVRYHDFIDGAPNDANAAMQGSAHHVYDLEEAPSPAGSTAPSDGTMARLYDLEEPKEASAYDLGAPDSESDIEL